MKFHPLHDRIVIRRLEGEEKTKGGIIIPDTAKGEASGGRRRQDRPDRPQGRRSGVVRQVVWHRGKIDAEELLIMKESDVLGVASGL